MIVSRRIALGVVLASLFGCAILSCVGIIDQVGPVWQIFQPNRPLQPKQRAQFLAEHQIQPIFVTEIDGAATAIVYRTPSEMGYYIADYGNGDVENIDYHRMSTTDYAPRENPAQTPISVLIAEHVDWYLVGLTINDAELAEQAHTANVIVSNGQSITLPIQEHGAALVWQEARSWPTHYQTVILYNAQGQELFRKST